jgi:membrane protein DedA with SNARE-associated domain
MEFSVLLQHLMHFLSDIGIIGLFLVMLIEGSSIPFPGIIIVLSYGYILNLSPLAMFITAAGMSLAYTISSFIPYVISVKIENRLPKKLKKGIEKAQHLFNRYGVWSIAFTRPFGIGNYISYVAGICKVKPLKYGIWTFIGIYPWSLTVLFLGKYYKGNLANLKHALTSGASHYYVIGVIALVILSLLLLFILKKKRKREKRNGKMAIMVTRNSAVEKLD